ncbi:iron complex transport system substrate-binding protein [Prauserella shujinwangii]|uniref:Iron complex transport system substrate-binding protein n=1 Tax=Prauserella shujinwangii TaxID=1453103 RepID=A0A2T0M003_9PSEU|nr:ABC transporter substrate-binding protein [Prauserella shujinwangii]PRX49933.1 iron complex transport system substrate-binding protein [Prauserella shujinwangii]
MPRHSARLRPALLSAALVAALVAGGCAAPGPAGDGTGPHRVTLRNCDREVTVEAPPRRAVSLNQGTTELLLALGLADRVVGSATWTEPVRADLAEAERTVPRLAEGTPSFESVLAAEPDFVIGLYHAIFTDERVASRERFAEFGVPTYLSPTSCRPEAAVLDEPVRLADIYREVTEVARIFGVPERGQELVSRLKQRVTEARRKVAALRLPDDFSVLFWFGQTESPYLAGSTGSPAIMTRALGIRNAYDDVRSMWPQVGWEDVLRRNPDLLVLADLTREGPGQSLESKKEFLTGDPAVARLDAVRAGRWLPMRGTELNLTISTVDGLEKLADKLVELYGGP